MDGDDDQEWSRGVIARLRSQGYDDVRTWIADDTELIAATAERYRIYCFRGSSTLHDWLSNLTTSRLNFYGRGKVHAGFCYALRSLVNGMEYRGVDDDIAAHRDRGQRILLTGHSKGAAVATVMAARELNENRGVHGLITFGSPRSVDRKLAKYIKTTVGLSGGEICRFVNRCDLVAALPTALRFCHVDSAHYFSKDGSLKIRPSLSWLLLDRLVLSLSRYARGQSGAWGDHSIDVYREEIRRKFKTFGVS